MRITEEKTTKEKIIEKLCSRKFWIALVTFVTMLIIALGVAEDTAVQIAAVIMAGASMISYIFGEGWIDAEEAKSDSEEE